MADAAPVTQAPAQATPAQPTQAAPTQAAPAKAEAAPKHKIKVDGQEIEVSQDELLSLAQQGKGAAKRFEEAARLRREAEQVIAFAKQNPTEFFKQTGMNAREWAEQYLLGEIQREAMNPEQKKAWENEQKLKDFESKDKEAKERAHQEQMQALEQQHMQNYDKMFVEALASTGLPKTAFTVMRMAQLTLAAEKNKIPVSSEQIAKIVREDYISEQKALFGAAEGPALLEMLGKDFIKKISKAQLDQYKSKKTNNARPPVESPKDPKKNPHQVWKDFQKKNRGFA